jgi:hypothetical protein
MQESQLPGGEAPADGRGADGAFTGANGPLRDPANPISDKDNRYRYAVAMRPILLILVFLLLFDEGGFQAVFFGSAACESHNLARL